MTIEKLIKCLELTRSDQDGEALAAIRKANNLRNTLGKSWGELVGTPPGASARQAKPDRGAEFDFADYPGIDEMFDALSRVTLPPTSAQFRDGVEDFYNQRGYLSERQHAALCNMYGRFAGKRGR